ncbi:MAG: pseudouridine-5'-phosphate glycosidase [Spirochaetaceae bacterium]|nr:pseudouridine-5'-phosphate glycosidase [Spirochaetia bacterium]MCF7951220.1 pseudouridine-5'-phosphate glycosidase [Spirochaetaceae bacterium]
MKKTDIPIDYSQEVANAFSRNQPLVALESTIISHGMPYPDNVATAAALEEAIRKEGAVPATIAIIDGRIKVGLSKEQIEFLGKSENIKKASRRDIPVILAEGSHAATTVAATMIAAALAGIHVFATGGIGGVHRGAETSFDISADLQELARSNVAVVCAGAKAILDLQLTLEYLETLGVPVLGYGTAEMPAFYSSSSGLAVDHRIDSPEAVAAVLDSKWKCGLEGGVLITNPIPEEFSMEKEKIDNAIEVALDEARRIGIFGKDLTPFLLGKIKELTGGESLSANIELVKNNATVAAKIAVAYSSRLKAK